MAPTLSFTRLCWALAFVFTTLLNITDAAGTPASSTFVHGGGPTNITLSLNVPQNNTDNLFFHFNGPASASWVAFGFGSQMAGSLMFVMYTSEDGKNVTVSPRIAHGHYQPNYFKGVTVSLFEGSGIRNNIYTVNAMCTGCRNWNSGSIDVSSTSQPMIYAIGPAFGLSSDDLSAPIRQHQLFNSFNIDLVQATGIGGVPGLASGENSTESSGSSDDDNTSEGWTVSPGVAAHALLMILSFLIIFPGGYLFLRIFEKVWLHYSIQSLGALLVVLGSSVGIAVSKKDNLHPNIDAPHQILGILILLLVVSTWSLGLIGHIIFRRTGTPAKLMLGHRVLAPLTVTLGLVNVCVGFNFAGHNKPIIGFVIITILMIIVVSSAILLKRRRAMKKGAMNTPAAMNFREGQAQGQEAPPPAYNTPAVPLQSYQPSGQGQAEHRPGFQRRGTDMVS